MFTQLDPALPVFVEGKGKGLAHAVIDYGPEHNLIWVTAIDASGEIWCASNPKVRMQANWTMGRARSAAESAMIVKSRDACNCSKGETPMRL
ncbi:hypothetical protein [Aurantiacibacter suaedae]|uniref:hypothetical protein n=1 Tax=Aurantiacibacter suaedae TaxID=2545755 RepID=UPI001F501545|nr:hypothetical protein [Aurantiacibacter suaedae]